MSVPARAATSKPVASMSAAPWTNSSSTACRPSAAPICGASTRSSTRAIGMGCPLTLAVSGPVTVSGQHQTWLIPLLETGWVAYLSTTDAVCYHDGHRSLDAYKSGPIHEVPIYSDDAALRDEGTIRVTDMAFDEDVLLDQDRFLSAVLAAARIPAQDDRHRTALPARASTTPRRRSRTAWRRACSPPATAAPFRSSSARPGDGSVFLNSMKLWAMHQAGLDPGLRLRSRPARRGLRGLRLPSLGTVRTSRARAGHRDSGRRRAQELQPAAGARARPGARAARRARLPLRRADRDRAGHRRLALLVPAGRSRHLGQGGQGHLSARPPRACRPTTRW